MTNIILISVPLLIWVILAVPLTWIVAHDVYCLSYPDTSKLINPNSVNYKLTEYKPNYIIYYILTYIMLSLFYLLTLGFKDMIIQLLGVSMPPLWLQILTYVTTIYYFIIPILAIPLISNHDFMVSFSALDNWKGLPQYYKSFKEYKKAGGHLLPPTDIRWGKVVGTSKDTSAIVEDIFSVPLPQQPKMGESYVDGLYHIMLTDLGYIMKTIEFNVHQNYVDTTYLITYYLDTKIHKCSKGSFKEVVLLQNNLETDLPDILIPAVLEAISVEENSPIYLKAETKESGMVSYETA